MLSFNLGKKAQIMNFLRNIIRAAYSTRHYSQEGEDAILHRIFDNRAAGFYVDVGAHHPKRFSNTYFFYLKGWRGINIDAKPGLMKEFNLFRKKDINIEAAVNDKEAIINYHVMSDGALNTFDATLAESVEKDGKYKILQRIPIQTQTLIEILDKHMPSTNQKIDFMSVDVEGLDLKVLKSNDWQKYRPQILLVESFEFPLADPQSSKIYNFLTDQNYELIGKTVNTLFYQAKP